MAKEIDRNKVVVFTGAGISAESGLNTFRGTDGLWNNHLVDDVATLAGWARDPELVLDFYNQLREEITAAEPNIAHRAIASLEERYEVVVVTQNIDNLHERAGSTNVIHLHGEITKMRSSVDSSLVYEQGSEGIRYGQKCELQSQLRPHVVWFGEKINNYDSARSHIAVASRVLVVGSSLSVFPASGLIKKARYHAEKIIIGLEIEKPVYGYQFLKAKAGSMVPYVVKCWMEGRRVS
ncbi:Sir2 family NAD-dependent protein deacetylase [Simiduia curdlanivorans]|uniref:protein acetyllysine N-acetyltransferase n=1 Tax=Simiduia curdlanivorans TaxID=1492769 RepID=A0ABV8V6C9_9GAMM|nr:Sir2 family NAD-dependent protein deacetylase [Simiduia curdlanivorans]MDN3638780.1 Sir2 family NAD-dependent protein deacetylase [Simiduia curdlanivorans]